MILTPFKLHALLGLILIAAGIIFDFAFVTRKFTQAFNWIIFGLMASGSILIVKGGYWEGRIGPVFKMEPPCYVLGIGLAAVLLGIALKIYVLVW